MSLFVTGGDDRREKATQMSEDFLFAWKERIADYQQQVREGKTAIEQPTLFDLPQTTWHTADEIDPFSLPRHPSDFYRRPDIEPPDDSNQGCLYFQIDHVSNIVLYVGETKLSARRRWLGSHDCKDYVLNYIELHRRYDLDVAVNASFWYHVPPQKKILQQWERELIFKWRPPFNKEMWEFYGQPFGKL
nr:GIY-YIG nuclease family protein [Microcystis aeruginosa]